MRHEPNRVVTRSGNDVVMATFSTGNANQIWQITPHTVYMNQENYAGLSWMWPVNNATVPVSRCFRSTSSYGFRSAGWHDGEDIGHCGNLTTVNGHQQGPPLVAVTGGTITRVAEHSLRGWYVDLTTNQGTFNNRNRMIVARYQHLHPTGIIGQTTQVLRGRQIGRMGTTGSSSGVHLHFEVLAGGDRLANGSGAASTSTTTNPLQFFRRYAHQIRTYQQTQ